MYRQNSEKALLGGGAIPPPPPSGYASGIIVKDFDYHNMDSITFMTRIR